MRKILFFIILCILVFSVFSCGKKAVDPGKVAEGVPVGVIKPEKKDIVVNYDTSATVVADDVRSLSFAVPGTIAELKKEEGERITSGEVIGSIDRSAYADGLKAADSGLESARNMLKVAEQQKRAAENQLTDARNRLEQADKDLQRFRQLFEDKVITEKELEDVELGFKSAKLGVDSAESALNMAETQVASAGQGVIAAQAQRDVAKKQFDDAVMTAPFNGTVNKKFESVGTTAGPGTPIYEVVADGAMKIDASLPERYLKDVTEGSIVLVSISNTECELSPQAITLVHREIKSSTGNFGVTINLKDTNGCLHHGMFAHLSFEVAKRSGVLSLPVEAIIELSGNKVVYVAENGKAVKKQVTTGLASKELIEISSGLTGNEDVILSGNRYVVDGSAVRITGTGSGKADGSNVNSGEQNPQ